MTFFLKMRCSECDVEYPHEFPATGGVGNAREIVASAGWSYVDGKDICPSCSNECPHCYGTGRKK